MTRKDYTDKLEQFRTLLEKQQLERIVKDGFDLELHRINYVCKLKMGRKYCNVDVGTSGKYMVDLSTGEIFGIKAYGVIHKGHRYGTLDTLKDYYWGHYVAMLRTETLDQALAKAEA